MTHESAIPPPDSVQSLLAAFEPGGQAYSWNNPAGPGTPVYLSYSFMQQVPDYSDDPGLPGVQSVAGFQPLSTAQQENARLALERWANVSGLNFVEVPDTEDGGDLRFGKAVFQGSFVGSAGYGYFPVTTETYWDPDGGDVWLNLARMSGSAWAPGSAEFETLLHEIGHAIGLKHPFAGVHRLAAAEDNTQFTVMSYTPGVRGTYQTEPQIYDRAAARYLYGTEHTQPAGERTWDPQELLLTSSGSDGSDVLLGNGTRELMYGWQGDDELYGRPGDDSLYGGEGNDTLVGGAGHDFLQGNQGDDLLTSDDDGANTLRGGQGYDRIEVIGDGDNLVAGDKFGDHITLFGDGDNLIQGGNFASTGNPVLDTDFLYVDGDGDNFVQGNIGNDTITLFGSGQNIVHGGKDQDLLDLRGTEGGNRLHGDKGDDTLMGGAGDDSLSGGTGADYFVLDGPGGHDLILDFEPGSDWLYGFNGSTPEQILAGATPDAAGNAVLSLGEETEVTLAGLSPAQLSMEIFGFFG